MGRRKEEIIVTADTSDAVRGFAAVGAAASTLTKRLDQADGRMANIVQTGLALGPALVPLGAIAVPAIAGLSTQLGLAAIAAGTAVLAFHGVGDALKALDAAQAAPTAANVEKLRLAMDKIGPAGQEFVLTLDKLEPKLKGLQATAQQGLFPGLTVGLDEVLGVLPKVNAIVDTTARTMGDIAARAGQGLNNQAFTAFFDYIEKTARPVLTEMADTFGNFIEGATRLIIAFDPLSRSFSRGLLGASEAFNTWATGLSKTKGFQDFLNYIHDNTPAALDALGSLANAFLQIIEAAAPVGAKLLPIISHLADGLASLADSSIGPGIIAAASAIGFLGRSLSLLETVGLRGTKNSGGFIATNYVKPFKSLRSELQHAMPTTQQLGQYFNYLGQSTGNASRKTLEARSAVRGYVAEVGRTVAPAFGKASIAAGGLALATSGLGDKMGLSNTATMAMMGTLAGPWGAAIGGSIGYLMDAAAANDDFEASVSSATRALESQPAAFGTQRAAIADAQKQYDDFRESIGQTGNWFTASLKQAFSPAAGKNYIEGLFGKSDVAEMRDKLTDLQTEAKNVQNRVGFMYEAFGHGDAAKASLSDLNKFATDLEPKLEQIGLTAQDVFGGHDPLGLKRVFANIAIPTLDLINSSDAGRAAEVGNALSHLGDAATTTKRPIDDLKASLDALFGVKLNLSQSIDDATRKLQDMGKAFKDADGKITGNSQKALDARDAARAYAQAQIDVAKAQADAKKSGTAVADTLIAARENYLKTARAAGVSESAIAAVAKQIGLTPRDLEIIIKEDGALSTTNKVRALARVYGLAPKKLHTLISEAGAHPTMATVRKLAALYHLTPHQVLTLLRANDQASKVTKKAHGLAKDFAKAYKAMLQAKDDGATKKAEAARKKAAALAKQWLAVLKADNRTGPGVAAAKAALASVHDKTVNIYVNTHRQTFGAAAVAKNPSLNKPAKDVAVGGFIRGPGTSTSDSIPANLSDGEYVVRAAAVDKYGVGLMHRINSLALAGGGYVRRGFAKGGSVTGLVDNSTELQRVASELRELRKELKTQRTSKNTRKLRNDYAASTAAAFVADPFSGTLGGFNNQIATETKKLAGTQTDLKALKKAGLSGGLLKDLAASGNSALIHQFAGLSPAQIASEEQAYRHRNNLSLAVGHQAANMAFPGIHDLKHEIHLMTHALHELRKANKLGMTVTNFNGKITAKDVEALAKKIHEKQRQAARLARNS